MGRRRSRSRGSGNRWLWIVVAVTLLVVAAPIWGGADTASEAFTSMSSDRGSSVDVAGDAGGLFGLDIAASVSAGTTSRLVTVTNQVGQTVDLTVTLDGTTGTLSGDQGTLQPGESLVVSIDVACGSRADTVSFTVDGTAEERFSGTTTRSTSIDTSGCTKTGTGREIAYVDENSGNLRTVAENGVVTTYDTGQVKAIGQPNVDLDGDADTDVPYVDGDDDLRSVDSDGNARTLDGSGEVGQAPLGVGDYDGTGIPEVYYVRDGNLRKAEVGSGTSKVVDRNWDVAAVAGVADFDGDGALEVVFTGKGNRLMYLDDTGRIVGATGKPTRVSSGTAISTPADYDDDGDVEVAAYDGDDGGIDLYDVAGEEDSFAPPYDVGETPMGALDSDGDGVPEIVHVDGNQKLRALDATDGTTTTVTDAGGSTLRGDDPGVK
ncbi:MAG: hypothetical protein ABEH56_03265 [Salinirussus sp.]